MQKLEEEFLASGGEWKRTILKDWFTIKTSVSFDKGNIELSNNRNGNNYEFIGRTSINNGIQGYVKHLGFEPNNGNTFSVIQVGENIAQFRKHKWYGSQNLFLLTPKFDWIISHYKYMIACINSGLKIFDKDYSSYPTVNTLNNLVIFLPIRNEQPDVSYMYHFISELQAERLQELQGYLQVTGLSNYTLTEEEQRAIDDLDNIKWGTFNIEKLFGKATRGKRLKSADRISGDLPFVTAGENDTGISAFIGNDVEVFKANTITIDMFGSAKYRNYQYGADDHIAVVHCDKLAKESVLFLTSAIHKVSNAGQFSYAKNFYAKDANELNISLPTKNNVPDYALMKTLGSAIQKLIIADVVKYADRELSAYQSVIGE
ncbi:type IV pili [Haemophilus influenzae biotype aegyptius]|uniref:restriction endonuclease subunit S n=1 Tax=Haemophilus influenzae TaxID=727 RepID=UPI0001F36CC6|nr:restriction endonuclease subunit S [Haemophilus influenzae]QEQ61373.1 type IV pili [Haemophilus influenzae biotype aegyptius]QEQ63130.1 type IV pili [Haemophilus influenzae biotype aegyptius]QEQ64935.1 type IV pili [Haemophilus influenzae biotype aegyptius]TMQ36426.1 type IV pili [Haemophilus influenzae biotype aegyptius]TMQ36509.1 type IV pili [Haemophilus influenzae biotype aegyptius]